MSSIGRILGRLIAVAVSYVLACIAAGLVVAGSYVVRAYMAGPIEVGQGRLLVETLVVSGFIASFVSIYAFAPAMIAIVVAEIFAIRRALFYAVCGAIAGALGYAAFTEGGFTNDAAEFGPALLLVTGAGIVAGFVYWYFAGRSAGILQRPAA